MVMKGYFTLSRAPELEPHHLMQLSVIPRIPHLEKELLLCRVESTYSVHWQGSFLLESDIFFVDFHMIQILTSIIVSTAQVIQLWKFKSSLFPLVLTLNQFHLYKVKGVNSSVVKVNWNFEYLPRKQCLINQDRHWHATSKGMDSYRLAISHMKVRHGR